MRYQKESRNPRVIFELCRKTLLLLSPIAPFITEELWEKFGGRGSIHLVDWPGYDQDIAREESITVIFQVNGKLRDKIDVTPGTGTEELIGLALASEKIQRFIADKKVIKKISVPDKLVNIVTGN